MKTVEVTFFKPSGKYYTSEQVSISEDIDGFSALHDELPKHHRIKDMYMMVTDSGDGKTPYIVPQLYRPLESP